MAGALTGRRVLVTRSEKQAEMFAELLEKEEAEPVIVPLLTFKKRDTKANFHLFTKLHEFAWLFFTSANGVRFFFDLLEQWNFTCEKDVELKIAAVGSKTAQELKRYNITPDFQPVDFNGRAMAKEFMTAFPDPGSILLVEGNLSRNDISEELSNHDVRFHDAVVYDTLIDEQAKDILNNHLLKDNIDIYTFTSPSTVAAFDKLGVQAGNAKELIKKKRLCVCIGRTTKKAAEQAGFCRIVTPEISTIEAMVEIMKKQSEGIG